MPFKNKAQAAACYAQKARGENGSWDCDEWSEHTNFKKIPKKAGDVIRKAANAMLPAMARSMSPALQSLATGAGPVGAAMGRAAGGVLGGAVRPAAQSMGQSLGSQAYGAPGGFIGGRVGANMANKIPAAGAAVGGAAGNMVGGAANKMLSMMGGAGRAAPAAPATPPSAMQNIAGRLRNGWTSFSAPNPAMPKAAAQLCGLLDKLAAHLPLQKTAGLRSLQASLALGNTLGTAIKTAFPHLNDPQRSFVAKKLVHSLAKVANSSCSSSTMPMAKSKSYHGSVAGGMDFMKQANPALHGLGSTGPDDLGRLAPPPAVSMGASALGSGLMGAGIGAGLGTPLGAAAGSARGNMAEGIGRGAIRGGATGAGAGIGALLGRLAAQASGHGAHGGTGALVGAGLGGLGGYMGSGALLGEPAGRKKKDEE